MLSRCLRNAAQSVQIQNYDKGDLSMNSKKLLALLLALVMVLGMLPMAALAATEALPADDNGTITLVNGKEYQLSADVGATAGVHIVVPQSVTASIDLNGHVLTVAKSASNTQGIEVHGTLTINDTSSAKTGKIAAKQDVPIAIAADGAGSKLTLAGGAVENLGTSANNAGLFCANGGAAEVTGGSVHSTYQALSGNNTEGAMHFVVSGGELTSNQGPAIYMPGPVDLKISGEAVLNGGVCVRMGKVEISGGTIKNENTSKNTDTIGDYFNYNGNVWFPNALTVFGGVYENKTGSADNALDLKITGGTIQSTVGDGIAIYALGKVQQTLGVTISGATTKITGKSGSPAVKAYTAAEIATLAASKWDTTYATHTNTPTVAITGGTFSSNPSTYVDTENYTVTKAADKDEWTVAAKPAAVKHTLAFANTAADEEFFGKTAADMGTFTIGKPEPVANQANTYKVTVTGTANYLDNYTGWNVAGEQEGHYLPIKITATPNTLEKITIYNRTVGAKDGKEINLTSGVENVAVFLDDTQESTGATKTTFKVVASNKAGAGAADANTYIIDFSGVALLPKPTTDTIAGTTTEVKVEQPTAGNNEPANVVAETKKDDTVVGSVALPADTKGLEGKVEIVVKPAEAPATINAGDAVKAAINADTTKVVEVVIKVTDQTGTQKEQFAGTDALDEANIVITIGNLDSNATYHVFSIDKTGKVTSYGYKKLGDDETAIAVSSKHLTYFAAAKVTGTFTAETVKNDTQVDKADEANSGLAPTQPTTPTTTAKYQIAAGGWGKVVTITGETNHYYLVQIGNKAPAAIFCVKAEGTTAKFSVADNDASPFMIWDAGTTEPTFPNGTPTGLAQVEKKA